MLILIFRDIVRLPMTASKTLNGVRASLRVLWEGRWIGSPRTTAHLRRLRDLHHLSLLLNLEWYGRHIRKTRQNPSASQYITVLLKSNVEEADPMNLSN